MKAIPVSLVLVTFLLAALPGKAEPPLSQFIQDKADMFRAPTRAKASAEIREIRRQFHRDVFIETLPSLTAEERTQLKSLSRAETQAYYAQIGQEHAQAAEVDGIHILYSRDPKAKFLQITVWPESQHEVFTDADAKRLYKLVNHRRYSSGVDQALLDGLAMIRDTLHRNLHLNHPDDGPANGWTMAVIVAMGMVGWIVLLVISMRMSKEEIQGPHPGLLGAMFGQVASVWIYDHLFPRGNPGPGKVQTTLFKSSRHGSSQPPAFATLHDDASFAVAEQHSSRLNG